MRSSDAHGRKFECLDFLYPTVAESQWSVRCESGKSRHKLNLILGSMAVGQGCRNGGGAGPP